MPCRQSRSRRQPRELFRVGEITAEMIELSCQVLIEKDLANVQRVLTLEDKVVDPVTKELERFVNTLIRLEAGLYHPEADVIFTETLRLLERISDHANNVGVSVSRN